MSVYTETRGAGPDLVMLHGWGLHSGIWGEVLDDLAARFRVTVVDLPGHGRSPLPAGPYTLETLAAAVAPVVPAGATLLGWSLGGLVATALALTQPQHLGRLVLVASTPRLVTGTDWPHALAPDALTLFAQDLERDYAGTLERFLALQVAALSPATRGMLRTLRTRLLELPPPPIAALRGALDILRSADMRAHLAALRAPTLALYGERDKLVPAAVAHDMQKLLPAQARVRVLDGAGHAPFLSHPAAFVHTLEEFLREHA